MRLGMTVGGGGRRGGSESDGLSVTHLDTTGHHVLIFRSMQYKEA